MATIEVRTSKKGQRSYAVKWRDGGGRGGRDRTQTLYDLHHAERLLALIKLNGQRFPDPAQLVAFGLQFLLDDVDEADPVEPAPALTVLDMVTRYLDYKTAHINAPSARTLKEYRNYVRLYIAPRPLGKAIADQVLFTDVDNWQNELATTIAPGGRKVLAKDSVLKVRTGVLAAAYIWAASPKSGPLLTRNPMVDSDAPKSDSLFRREILFTPSEYRLFLTIARTVDPKWADMTETAAAIGPRFGEIILVEAKDVDRARAVIHIRRRFTGGRIEDGTKNGTTREVPVPHPIMTRIVEPAMATGGLLFPGPTGGRWSYGADWDRWDALRTALAAAGLDRHLTHHSLRHGYSTWLSSERIDPVKRSAVMGHRKKKKGDMDRTYTQLTEADLAMIRQAMTTLVCS